MQNISSKNQETIDVPIQIKPSFITLESSQGDLLLGVIDANSHKLTWMSKAQNQVKWIFQKEQDKETTQLPPLEKIVALFDNKADFHIFFTKHQNQGSHSLWMAISHNYGRTWHDMKQLSDEIQDWDVFTSPIIIQNGLYVNRFVLPYTDQSVQRSAFLISQDNGKTWGSSLYLEPHEEAGMLDDELSGGTLYPSIIENLDGHLRAYFHVINWPKIYSSTSPDLGETWSESSHMEQIEIDPSKPYDMIKLLAKDGDLTTGVLLCGWNPDRSASDTAVKTNIENEFKLLVSMDEGNSFETIKILYSGQYNANFGCHLVQDTNREIHIFYSTDPLKIIHEIFDLTPQLTTLSEEQKKTIENDENDTSEEDEPE